MDKDKMKVKIVNGMAECECGGRWFVECVGEIGSGKTSMDDWKFCPICGRRIEVKERAND